MEHRGYNNVTQGARNNLKTYQDQEFTEDLGLDTHEWKFRISDPAIGRFWQIDPLAEKYSYNGTYNFSENRIIDGVELEGLEAQNFMSKFKKPNELSVKRPSKNAQRQSYSVSVSNPNKSFSEVRDNFLSRPQDLLSNSKAKFNSPVDGEGKTTDFADGNFIKINIDGPLNDGFVKIEDISSNENAVSASFVTLEGHVEKGEITFSITTDKEGNLTFSINNRSDVDQGTAKLFEGFSRSEQMKSWQEVLTNFVNMTGGTETSRGQKTEDKEK